MSDRAASSQAYSAANARHKAKLGKMKGKVAASKRKLLSQCIKTKIFDNLRELRALINSMQCFPSAVQSDLTSVKLAVEALREPLAPYLSTAEKQARSFHGLPSPSTPSLAFSCLL